jgi:hypothetical protein
MLIEPPLIIAETVASRDWSFRLKAGRVKITES